MKLDAGSGVILVVGIGVEFAVGNGVKCDVVSRVEFDVEIDRRLLFPGSKAPSAVNRRHLQLKRQLCTPTATEARSTRVVLNSQRLPD